MLNLTKEQKEKLGLIDERKDFYFKVENTVVDEKVFDNVYEAYLFVVLSRYCNNNQAAFPSLKTLAEKCYCSTASIKRALKNLEEKEFIKRVQRKDKDKNIYESTLYAVKNIGNFDSNVSSDGTRGWLCESQGVGSVRAIKNNNIYKEQDKKTNKKDKLIEQLNELNISDSLKQKFIEFINYRKEIKKSLKTIRPITSEINKIGKDYQSEEHLIESIDWSMSKEYLGIFPVKNYNKYNKENKTDIDTKIVNRIGKIEMLLDTNNIIYEKDKLFLEETLTDDRYSKYRYILDKIDKAEIV